MRRMVLVEKFVRLEMSAEIKRVRDLARLERYERRARSRRRRAMRDFMLAKKARAAL